MPGLLLALGGGELDVQDSQINNIGAGLNGIVVTGTGSELLVDTTTLKLVGDGTVTLASGGAILGNGNPGTPDTLENVDNTIAGTGTIGDSGNGELALVNDVGGTIAAFGDYANARYRQHDRQCWTVAGDRKRHTGYNRQHERYWEYRDRQRCHC